MAANGQTELGGAIAGHGGLVKTGGGTLLLEGSTANSYAGSTTVNYGTVSLSKTSAIAIPGALVIGNGSSPALSEVVQLLQANQFSPNSDVTLAADGALYLSGTAGATIGSLAGGGAVGLAFSHLTLGGDNRSTAYSGNISGFGGAVVTKAGTGTWTLTGNNNLQGTVQATAGTLLVNGSLAQCTVTVANNGLLGGTGTIGPLVATTGRVEPGFKGAGILNCGNVSLGSGDSYSADLNGAAAGTGYNQLAVTGTVSLGNAILKGGLGFASPAGSQFVLVSNDGTDPVEGTFKGLPEGAQFSLGTAQFQITYKGGDGNDVVLTQLSAGAQAQIPAARSAEMGLGARNLQLTGNGVPGGKYEVQVCTNLAAQAWTTIAVVPAAATGALSFTDPNAPTLPQCFYRFKAE